MNLADFLGFLGKSYDSCPQEFSVEGIFLKSAEQALHNFLGTAKQCDTEPDGKIYPVPDGRCLRNGSTTFYAGTVSIPMNSWLREASITLLQGIAKSKRIPHFFRGRGWKNHFLAN